MDTYYLQNKDDGYYLMRFDGNRHRLVEKYEHLEDACKAMKELKDAGGDVATFEGCIE